MAAFNWIFWRLSFYFIVTQLKTLHLEKNTNLRACKLVFFSFFKKKLQTTWIFSVHIMSEPDDRPGQLVPSLFYNDLSWCKQLKPLHYSQFLKPRSNNKTFSRLCPPSRKRAEPLTFLTCPTGAEQHRGDQRRNPCQSFTPHTHVWSVRAGAECNNSESRGRRSRSVHLRLVCNSFPRSPAAPLRAPPDPLRCAARR